VGGVGHKHESWGRYRINLLCPSVQSNHRTVPKKQKKLSELLEEGFMTESLSSLWRTAYVSAIFETDPARMTLKIADARAAITERLNSPIEIGRFEHEGIEAARQRLATLKAQRVEVVKLALSTGDTPS
jgi:hypothetical protein